MEPASPRRRCFAAGGAALALAPWLWPATGEAAPERPRVTVSVPVLSDLACLPLVVAEQQGFLRAEGLEVEWTEGGGPADITCGPFEQVLQLQARGIQHPSFALLCRAPGVALGVSIRHLPQFRQLSDLRGRRIGIAASGSTAHLMAQVVMLRVGVAPADWQLVPVGGATLALQAVRAGQVDALCGGEPAMTLLEQRAELRVVSDARSLKGASAVFGGPMPADCLHASQEFILRNPGVCQALAHAVVRALRWLQTAGPSDLLRTVPEPFRMGDLGLYIAAFERMRETYSTDGMVEPEGARTALRALATFEPALPADRVDLARSYTNAFVARAAARGR